MLRCALKLTHDGTIAIADGSKLLASVEMEKLDNRPRWSPIVDLRDVDRVLKALKISSVTIDRWLVDGWVAGRRLQVSSGNTNCILKVASYQEKNISDSILRSHVGSGLRIAGRNHSYISYPHLAGHILASFATSPFAKAGKPAFILVWDGGSDPRLYQVYPHERKIENYGPLFPLNGHVYSQATRYFGPFRQSWPSSTGSESSIFDRLFLRLSRLVERMRYGAPLEIVESEDVDPENSVAGRLMAIVAYGEPRHELLRELKRVYCSLFESSKKQVTVESRVRSDGSGECTNAAILFNELSDGENLRNVPELDVLATIHQFLGSMLVERLEERLKTLQVEDPIDLCISGGCALNIKWNRLLRESPFIHDVFVPPFPNDSGSAIGMLACDLFVAGSGALKWNPYLGLPLQPNEPPVDDWRVECCDLGTLASLLATNAEPIVFLNERAELGPRSLGHRSILASATHGSMRDRLNDLKKREPYRPIAPVCLEHRSADIFEPGGRDPYMLFDHTVRLSWRDRVPAIVHRDGSARLQTVSAQDEPKLFELLSHYERQTGIPLLCNTSANFSGRGFFPDAASAARWGLCKYIWANGKLFTKISATPSRAI